MRFTKKFICDFIQNSNLIEGIDNPREDIELVYDMAKKPKVEVDSSFLRKHPEILNSIAALDFIKTASKEKPTLASILQLHLILMRGLMPYKDEGCFRAMDVYVGGAVCPSPNRVMRMLNTFVERWDDKLSIKFPEPFGNHLPIPNGDSYLLLSEEDYTDEYLRHMEYEYIHPFSDGNGRSGRLLYLWDSIYHKRKHHMILFKERPLYYASLRLYRSYFRDTLEVKIKK